MKNLFKTLLAGLLLIALFSACNKDNVAPEIMNSTLTDTTIRVGEQLTFNATIQSDLVFTYSWFVDNELKSSDAIFVFTPDHSGEYNLKLLAENKYGSDSILGKITVLPKIITIDFEELSLAQDSYWNGNDGSGGFSSGSAFLQNLYYTDYLYWEGFSYSNQNDTITQGNTNQYSVYDATNNENKFAAFFLPFYGNTSIVFNDQQLINVQSIKVCNATYPALSMLYGDFVGKKFGGESGNDEDYFKLIIKGLDASGNEISSVDFYLADYRFSDNTKDYIVKKWTTVDLTSLGAVNQITFTFESSDNGSWGINTPTYVCIDDLAYSEKEN